MVFVRPYPFPESFPYRRPHSTLSGLRAAVQHDAYSIPRQPPWLTAPISRLFRKVLPSLQRHRRQASLLLGRSQTRWYC